MAESTSSARYYRQEGPQPYVNAIFEPVSQNTFFETTRILLFTEGGNVIRQNQSRSSTSKSLQVDRFKTAVSPNKFCTQTTRSFIFTVQECYFSSARNAYGDATRTVLPAVSNGQFLTAPSKNLVNQCCYISPTTRAFIFYRKKHRENDLKKCEAAFKFEVMCDTFFCVLRALQALSAVPGRHLSPTLPLLRMWWHPIFPVYWCACVCLCAFVCAYLCAGKRKKMALTQIPPEEKFYTSMPWWQLC